MIGVRHSRTAFLWMLAVLWAPACSGSSGGDAVHVSALYRQGEFSQAEKAAHRELQRTPDDAELRRLEIAAAIRSGEHQRGVDLYLQWHRARRHYDPIALRDMAVSTLWHGLQHSDASVRLQAVRTVVTLGRSRARRHVQVLERPVTERIDDSDERVAAAAVGIKTGSRGRQRARQLFESADDGVRASVIRGLKTGSNQDAKELLERALTDRSARVRRAAVVHLGRAANIASRDVLLRLAEIDAADNVRAAALRALASRKHKRVLAVAEKALQDRFVGVRLAALDIVTQWPKRHRDTLSRLARSPDAFVSLRASVALQKRGDTVPIQPLQLALAHAQWSVRVAALNAIAELLSEREAIGMLKPLVIDQRVEVRLAAARVLMRFGRTSRARAILVSALDDARDEPRVQAAIDLLRMNDQAGREALIRLSASPSVATRRQAARAHRYTDNPDLPLVRAMGDTAAVVRITAAATLLELL